MIFEYPFFIHDVNIKDVAYFLNIASIKKGYGKLLIQEMENLAKSLQKRYVKIDCTDNNLKLKEYYLNIGYIELENKDIFYSNDQKACLIQKELI